ncbi:hypothetical protein E2493_09210 [Sphingomonas parva]|uniref:Uncharacterized protein n=1 Tax=Sphingomonas parva TaxID=2555898 RepID=A0A4Y8ZTH2_9SPHN|nr:hypothetical protein [Sphingomonas parva]TFI58592.1 hypothetical protein E2493_09210 [Sphingomonas parva]
MDMSNHPSHTRAIGTRGRRVESLLRRYPNVSADEATEIARFLKSGRSLEVGLVTANEELEAQLALFREDHGSDVALSTKDWLIILALLGIVAVTCLLLWDAGLS